MDRKNGFKGLSVFLCMLILILDGKTALVGAQQGTELCLKAIIPALFPFFVLSILLTNLLAGTTLQFLSPIGRLCGIPSGMEGILISAFLGGYPAGAQSVAQAYRNGSLNRKEAQRMLAFCSNAGPSFLFGIVSQQFSSIRAVWILWGTHILSAIAVAVLMPRTSSCAIPQMKPAPISLITAMKDALQAIASVCGWVILFRILLTFCQRWCLWLLPKPGQVTVAGILELSNGCMELQAIQDERLRFLLCSGLLAFGGICVMMQTASVIQGLSLRHYLSGKCLQTLFSLSLAAGFAYGMWLPSFLLPGILWKWGNMQKSGSIQEALGV